MIVHELPSGKKIQLVTEPKSHLKRWQFNPGGELPQELQGLFTQDKYAIQALTQYLNKKSKVVK